MQLGLVVVAVALAGYLVYSAVRWLVWFNRRYIGMKTFFEVKPGVLYRSGQLSRAALEEVRTRHGIRTIVCLRASTEGGKRNYWSAMEQAFCRDAAVRFVNLPCNHRNPPTDEQVDQFIAVMSDPANHPVLLHCKLGRQRTGLMAAIFRLRFDGWSREQAYAEMDRFDFQPDRKRHHKLAAVLDHTAERLERSRGSTPTAQSGYATTP